ncbi:MAG: hypothetical protein M3461_04925 [Pseudomonadota bacterium]|nr:hypothetical protein [Pseudomonadota bacterium]
MARLTARIIRLERLLPTGLEAELQALSDEELEQRLEAVPREMSEEDVRTMAREYPDFFTAEVLEDAATSYQPSTYDKTRRASSVHGTYHHYQETQYSHPRRGGPLETSRARGLGRRFPLPRVYPVIPSLART